MAFYGRAFLYDATPSEQYGLYLSDLDANAINEMMAANSLEIEEQKLFRRSTPYFYGATASPKLSFPFSAFSENDMDADLFALASKWLFSPRSYKKFQVDQYDMQNLYFNCLLTEPKVQKVGNIIKGFSCTAVCDSPFAWMFPTTLTKTYTQTTVDDTFVFNNSSDDSGDYLYPTLVITTNNTGGSVTITNNTDSGRVFEFTGLSAGEVITVNNSLQTISSSLSLKRLSNFNKNFFRLVSGVNSIRLQGNILSVAMTTQFISKKI